MLLEEIISRIPGIELRGNTQTRIRGIAHDSRLVEEGFLFVAIKGEKTDGMRFLDQAIQRGAAALASESSAPAGLTVPAIRVPDARKFLAEAAQAFFADPTSALRLVAITGTNGKTTTTYLLDSIFQQAGLRACLIGTIGMKIADRHFPTSHTTPEASDLLSFLRRAADSGCTHGALEVSSHALVMKRVYGARFTLGVFTNLTQDHLDFHQDMESYYKAKRLLFVAEGGNRTDGAVINTDDPYGRRLAADIRCPTLSYGFSPGVDIQALLLEGRTNGTLLRIATPKGEIELRSRLIGRPNAYNILASVGAALSLGIEPDTIRRGVEALAGVPGRMEVVDAGQPFTVLVDYAHTPDALRNLLETGAALFNQRLITVFGCGGDRDKTKRAPMGEIAGRFSSFVVATSDNPRSEDPLAILAEIEKGLQSGAARYQLIPDRRKAIAFAFSMAQPGDLVVIAGKGHEACQVVGNQTYPFDDRAVARELIFGIMNARGSRS